MDQNDPTNLRQPEYESIHIIREVAANKQSGHAVPIGKDPVMPASGA